MKKRCILISCILFCIFLLSNIVSGEISITSNYSFNESQQWQQNLTNVFQSSLALGDIDNDGDLDLVLSGCVSGSVTTCSSSISKIYINNGTTLTESSQWQNNLTGITRGSLALGDIDNDGDLDLSLIGCINNTQAGSCDGTKVAKIYLNNGTTLTESSQWQNNLTGTFYGSSAFGDIDNDGDLDLVLTGNSANGKIAKIYLNNGTTLTESSQWQNNLIGVYESSLALGDIDNDGDLDLVLSGDRTPTSPYMISKVYINNGTTLTESSQWQNNLVAVSEGSFIFGDVNNDADLDLLYIGCCDRHLVYFNNLSTFYLYQTDIQGGGNYLIGQYDGSIAFGDYDNDGDLDHASIGCEAYNYNRIYNYNGSIFIADSNASEDLKADNMASGSLVWIDLDNDADIDLMATGMDGSNNIKSKVYISNASLTKNNTKPNPTTASFSSSYSDGVLKLGWGNGSDSETNTSGLYYNLMVGNETANHTIVSGVYGGSSNPTAGYFGNMMQRKNISLNRYLSAGTYNWYVQTIDTGLQKSNWSAVQSINIGGDTTAPVISSVSSSVTSSTATITWTTDETSNSSVVYGTTTATGSEQGSSGLVTSHSISLSSLSASTLYYYNVSSCDYWGNCNTSSQSSFTTSAASSPGSPGGGSSGGSSTPTTPKTTPKEFDIDFSTSTSGILEAKQGDIKTFSFQGEVKHSITTLTITSNSATLLITSDPITIQINSGETKQIDINNDDIDDLEIKLISIISGKAKFTITTLAGADIIAEEELEKEALFDVKVDIVNLFEIVKSGGEVIAEIEAFNVNNIGQVDIVVDYYITSKEDNQTKLIESSDTLAIEAVTSFVRSLRIPLETKSGKYLFYADVKYNNEIMASGDAEFRVIKNYNIFIIVGVIVLFALGVVIYLWKIKKKEEKDIGMLKRTINKLKRKKRKK